MRRQLQKTIYDDYRNAQRLSFAWKRDTFDEHFSDRSFASVSVAFVFSLSCVSQALYSRFQAFRRLCYRLVRWHFLLGIAATVFEAGAYLGYSESRPTRPHVSGRLVRFRYASV